MTFFYSLLPVKRAGGKKKSERRRAWHFFWNEGVLRVNVATPNPVAIAKPGTKKKCEALRLTGRRE